jgi:hypothetical protein
VTSLRSARRHWTRPGTLGGRLLRAALALGAGVVVVTGGTTGGETTDVRAFAATSRDAAAEARAEWMGRDGTELQEDDALDEDGADGSTCGRPGLPPCPLQQWMRQKLAKSLASNDLPAVAQRFDGLSRLAPDPTWTTWATFANDGAAAARAGDVAKARKACSGCHAAWRKKYRQEHRTRPVPGG